MKSKIVWPAILIALAGLYVISGAQQSENLGDYLYPIHSMGQILRTPVANCHDTTYILLFTEDAPYYHVSVKHPSWNRWYNLFGYEYYSNPYNFEFYVGQSGHPYIYDPEIDTLYVSFPEGGYYPGGRTCPGRPVIDSLGNVHLIWRGTDSTLYYGYSSDTLRSISQIDTLSSLPNFIYLISTPKGSMVSAIFYSLEEHSIYKYSAVAGSPIDFSETGEVIPCDTLIYPPQSRDIALDYSGDIILIYQYFIPTLYGCHYTWSERSGVGFVDES
jgi:hypothetical protein